MSRDRLERPCTNRILNSQRTVALLTTGRQDWGILRSTCTLLRDDPAFELRVLAGGMHLSSRFGDTGRLIEAEGFSVAAALPWTADDPAGASHHEAARAVGLVGDALEQEQPDFLILVGDRFETAAAALAATLQRVPIVHLHGGEETAGAFDNSLRHAITKLAHLHLVSHPLHAARVIAMGEDPSTVHVVGAPGLDNMHRRDLPTRTELEVSLGVQLRPPVVVVTHHPATLGGNPESEASAIVTVMDRVDATYVVTMPNTDPGSDIILRIFHDACGRPSRVSVDALGERRYWGLLRIADVLLGNSSSALIEGTALGVPAVNVGDRQAGRLRGENVIDVPADSWRIEVALRMCLSEDFRARSVVAHSPYGDGHSGSRVLDILKRWTPPKPPRKPPVSV